MNVLDLCPYCSKIWIDKQYQEICGTCQPRFFLDYTLLEINKKISDLKLIDKKYFDQQVNKLLTSYILELQKIKEKI